MENIDLLLTTTAIVIAFVMLIIGTFSEFKKGNNE